MTHKTIPAFHQNYIPNSTRIKSSLWLLKPSLSLTSVQHVPRNVESIDLEADLIVTQDQRTGFQAEPTFFSQSQPINTPVQSLDFQVDPTVTFAQVQPTANYPIPDCRFLVSSQFVSLSVSSRRLHTRRNPNQPVNTLMGWEIRKPRKSKIARRNDGGGQARSESELRYWSGIAEILSVCFVCWEGFIVSGRNALIW